jgi:hypothetical protein
VCAHQPSGRLVTRAQTGIHVTIRLKIISHGNHSLINTQTPNSVVASAVSSTCRGITKLVDILSCGKHTQKTMSFSSETIVLARSKLGSITYNSEARDHGDLLEVTGFTRNVCIEQMSHIAGVVYYDSVALIGSGKPSVEIVLPHLLRQFNVLRVCLRILSKARNLPTFMYFF